MFLTYEVVIVVHPLFIFNIKTYKHEVLTTHRPM